MAQEIVTKENTEVAVKTESQQLMCVIASMAQDKESDTDKLKQLVQIRNDELARIAKLSFSSDFVKMKPHLKRIQNKHDNTQTRSKYAKLEDINKEVDPVLEQFGFATSTSIVSQTEASVTVKASLIHKDGHSEETQITMPLDKTGIQGTVNKTGPHALASSIKYARRVSICALLNISTGDGEDKDGNEDSTFISIEQAAEFDLRLRAISDKALPNFLRWAKVKELTEILERDFVKSEKAVSNMESEAKKVKGIK